MLSGICAAIAAQDLMVLALLFFNAQWDIVRQDVIQFAKNYFTRSLWTVHTKFHEVLNCLRKLAKNNIKPRDATCCTEHERVKEDSFWPYFKGAIEAIDGSHVLVVVSQDEVVNHTCQQGYTS